MPKKSAFWWSATLLLFCLPGAASGQTTDLSGTWQLVTEGSRINAEAALVGLIGAGAPKRLHLTQPANGTLVVESEVNESHTRIYLPNGETQTPVFLGQAGSISMTSRWEGASLVSEGSREIASESGKSVTEVKEVLALDAEGRMLTIAIAVTGAEGRSESRLTYQRTRETGPCGSWESPCKKPER